MTFGDFDVNDAYDTAPADPEQVARRLQRYRRDRGLDPAGWDDLTPAQRLLLIAVVADLLAWLRRQGAT